MTEAIWSIWLFYAVLLLLAGSLLAWVHRG